MSADCFHLLHQQIYSDSSFHCLFSTTDRWIKDSEERWIIIPPSWQQQFKEKMLMHCWNANVEQWSWNWFPIFINRNFTTICSIQVQNMTLNTMWKIIKWILTLVWKQPFSFLSYKCGREPVNITVNKKVSLTLTIQMLKNFKVKCW